MNLTADSLKLDKIQLFFGAGYQINNHLTVRQPRLGDLIDLGENDYYKGLNAITQTVWEAKAILWDAGYDWEKITDFEFFCMKIKALDKSITKVFFEEDIDFSKFDIKENTENGELVLEQVLTDGYILKIDQYIYSKISCFLRTLHGMGIPTIRYPTNKTIKKLQIEMDKREARSRARKNEDSFLLNCISALIASSEFKYDRNTIRQMPLFEFYITIDRIQIIRQAQAVLTGMYANADFSKIKDFNTLVNWLKPISKNTDSKIKLGNS